MEESKKGALLLAAAMLIFGFLGIAAKSLAASPLMLLYGMQATGLAVFFSILIKKREFSTNGIFKIIVIMTLFALLLDFSFFTAVKLTSVANAVFIKFTAPVFILIFAPFIIKEKREKKSFFAIPTALVGLFLILYQGSFSFDSNLVGMFYALITAISLALFIILVKRITQRINVRVMLFYRYLISVIVLTPLVVLEGQMINFELVTILVIFGMVFAVIGTLIHLEGVKRIKAQQAGILGVIEPLSATVYAIFLFSEIPTLFTVIGGLLILLSSYLVIRS